MLLGPWGLWPLEAEDPIGLNSEHLAAGGLWLIRRGCCAGCSADGNFTVKLMTKATIHSDGLVMWKPPAIYPSLCTIHHEYYCRCPRVFVFVMLLKKRSCLYHWIHHHEYAVRVTHKSQCCDVENEFAKRDFAGVHLASRPR